MNEPSPRVARKVKARRGLPGGSKGTVKLRSPVLTHVAISIAFLALAAWIIASDFLFLRSSEMLIGLMLGAATLVIAVVFFVLPLLIGNILTEMTVIIRYGIQFSEEIPLYEIEKAELLGRLPASPGLLGGGARLGVEYSIFDRRFTVLRSKRGIVRIRLANEISVRNWFIPRQVKEIVFDTLDGEEVVRRIDAAKSLGAE